MKRFIRITVSFVIIMLVCLAVLIAGTKGLRPVVKDPAGYTDSELEIYKAVWDDVESASSTYKSQLTGRLLVFWAAVFAAGLFVIFYLYRKEIRPVEDMQQFAREIAKGNLDVPLPISEGDHYGGFTESFDLMREELRASRERELEADRAKREFAAELSHDLKTPVATIRATCDVLELKVRKQLERGEASAGQSLGMSREEAADILEKVSVISDRINTISELTDDVFHANLDDIKEVQVTPEETESMWIEEAFRGLKDQGDIVIENHIPACLVYVDKLRMEQVIDNVVTNSRKYAGTEIRVSFEETEAVSAGTKGSSGYIKVTVRDRGPGVPADELPLLVEKYYRGRQAKGRPGYGLGMYLVNRYMEQMHGGLQYRNDGGFAVELFVAKV